MSQPYVGQCEHLRQTVGIEETLDPIQATADCILGFKLLAKCYWHILTNSTADTDKANWHVSDDWRLILTVQPYEIFTVIAFAILWTVARYFLVNFIFRPTAIWAGVLEKNVEKCCESAWKGFNCLVLWSYAFHIVFFRDYNFFYEPMQQFSDWAIDKPPPSDLALCYAIEFGYYLHCVYFTLYVDAWRKDSVVMLLHHFVAMTLLSFSYMIRCLKVGVLLFSLNEIGDAFLELGKVCTYLRHRTTGFSKFFSNVSDVMLFFFASSWFFFRLWFHFVKVWRGGALGVWASHPLLPIPFHIPLYTLLSAMTLFYLYWSWYIIIFVLRVLFNRRGSAEDPREDEDDAPKKSDGKKLE